MQQWIKQRKYRLSAGALLLLFVLHWAAIPATLARPQLNGCAMECCEEEGFCCCVESRREALAAQPDANQIPQVSQLIKKCKADCATTSSAGVSVSLLRAPHQLRLLVFTQTQTCFYQSRIEYQAYLSLKESSPRAPPRIS